MNLIEMATALLAPHTCIVCAREGPPLCQNCARASLRPLPPACYRCYRSLSPSLSCRYCVPSASLRRVWRGTPYQGSAKEAIALLKFSRAKAMASALAGWLNSYLPPLPNGTIITHVPTAYSRIRLRGYDQSQLIAKSFAKKRGLPYKEALRRVKSTRQVGSSRVRRFSQLEGAFSVYKPVQLRGHPILLIDDVLTTGATLESAANSLYSSGVDIIDATVIAHAIAKK